VLAALLAALAVVSVGHVMLTTVHGRRHDLAVLRVLGADRPLLSHAVHWQATAFTAVALVVGAPLGLVLGRVVFTSFAASLGTIEDPVFPFAAVVAIAAGVVALANAAAAVPARRTRRLALATLLRAE